MKQFAVLATLALLAWVPMTQTSGSIEMILRSPQPATVFVTACTWPCFGHDLQAEPNYVEPNVPLHLDTAEYSGPSEQRFFLNFRVEDSKTNKTIGELQLTPTADTAWTTEYIPTAGFLISLAFHNKCKPNYYGKRCATHCEPLVGRWSCAENGSLKCAQGWAGKNCLTAICSFCSENEICVSPETCMCRKGWAGPSCSRCVPSSSCMHGTCANNQPGTCACHAGFTGPDCDKYKYACQNGNVCHNGGTCVPDSSVDGGFKCVCAKGFYGSSCEERSARDLCKTGFLCHNGGTCRTTNATHCVCPERFTGLHCEYETHLDCSTKVCPSDQKCFMLNTHPTCLNVKSKNMTETPDSSFSWTKLILVVVFFSLFLGLWLRYSNNCINVCRQFTSHRNREENAVRYTVAADPVSYEDLQEEIRRYIRRQRLRSFIRANQEQNLHETPPPTYETVTQSHLPSISEDEENGTGAACITIVNYENRETRGVTVTHNVDETDSVEIAAEVPANEALAVSLEENPITMRT